MLCTFVYHMQYSCSGGSRILLSSIPYKIKICITLDLHFIEYRIVFLKLHIVHYFTMIVYDMGNHVEIHVGQSYNITQVTKLML